MKMTSYQELSIDINGASSPIIEVESDSSLIGNLFYKRSNSLDNLQYEIFWFVNNISNLSFGQDSKLKRLIKTKLIRDESTYVEIDNQRN